MYIDEYLKKLKLNAIIFDDDILDDIEYPETKKYIFSKEFFDRLLRRTSISLMIEDLDCHVINNIREVLSYVRFNGVDREFIPIINKILINLNNLKSNGSSTFYKTQYLKRQGKFNVRTLEKKDLHLFTDAANRDFLKTLRDYMSLDHDILDTLLYSSDEEFGNKISDYVIEEFLSVINVVSYECNELFKIEIFKKRVHYMLKNLSLLEGKRTIDSIYKAYKINKRLKKVI